MDAGRRKCPPGPRQVGRRLRGEIPGRGARGQAGPAEAPPLGHPGRPPVPEGLVSPTPRLHACGPSPPALALPGEPVSSAHPYFSPVGAQALGPEGRAAAGQGAGPSSLERPPCSRLCRSGTAKGRVGHVRDLRTRACPLAPPRTEHQGACDERRQLQSPAAQMPGGTGAALPPPPGPRGPEPPFTPGGSQHCLAWGRGGAAPGMLFHTDQPAPCRRPTERPFPRAQKFRKSDFKKRIHKRHHFAQRKPSTRRGSWEELLTWMKRVNTGVLGRRAS